MRRFPTPVPGNGGRHRFSASIALAAMLVLTAGCEAFDDTPDPLGPGGDGDAISPVERNFAAPQGVAVTGDLVFVANPDWRYGPSGMTYGQGFVTVVRRSDLRVVNRIPTTARNPQVVAVHGDDVWVLSSGETTWDAEKFLVSPAGDGALDLLDARTADAAVAPTATIPLPRSKTRPLVGYPSSLELDADGRRAWVGSGTTAALFRVDLEARTVLRGAEDPIAVGDMTAQDGLFLRNGPDGILFAGSANRDRVIALDTATMAPASLARFPFDEIAVGKSADLERVADLAYRGGRTPDLFVLMNLSSSISAITTAAGFAGVVDGFATTGKAPNRLGFSGDRLLVVNSTDNNLTAVDTATGASAIVAALPVGTNPYDVAVVEGTPRLAYVTGNLSNRLLVVDLDDGRVIAEIP